MKLIKHKLLVYFIILIFILTFFINAFIERNKIQYIYIHGIDKLENQEYQEAQKILSELGDYKDSIQYINLAQTLENNFEIYNKAIDLFRTEDYEEAIKLFNQIGDFIFAQEYVKMANNLIKTNQEIDEMTNSIDKYCNDNNYILAIQKISELNTYIQDKQENFQNDIIIAERVQKAQENFHQEFKIGIELNDYDQNIQKDFKNAIQKLSDFDNNKDHIKTLENCKIELARLQQATTISAGIRYSTGIISEGKIKYSGDYSPLEKELSTWSDIISISLQGHIAIGLKKDGTVLVAGTIPEYPDYYIDVNTWKDIIAISSGQQYIVGLRSDGTLVAQGHNGDKQLDINNWKNVVAISCGWRHTVGLDSNGNINISGFQSTSQLDNIKEHKNDWTDIIAISAAGGSTETSGHNAYTAALKQNGKVITTLPNEIQEEISNWNNIVAISAGDFYLVGLTSNGNVLIQQVDYSIDLDDSMKEISNWNDIVTISAGRGFTLAVNSKGKLFASGFYKNHQIDIDDDWGDITCYKDEWRSIFDPNLRWNAID